MGIFPKSKNCILVAVDYVSKWVEAMPYRSTDAKTSKKIFHEIIFPRFGIPKMVISDGGSHFIDRSFQNTYQTLGSITISLLYIILKQVARQRHQINKSRIFFRK
jgi:hypothetical protein